MAEKIRLFKIASEINIGKENIVEYLQSKGFAIENKPTALLTSDMLDVVYDKFKKEKKAAEVQRDKLQKHKDVVPKSGKSENDEHNFYVAETINKSAQVSSILEERFEAAKKTGVSESNSVNKTTERSGVSDKSIQNTPNISELKTHIESNNESKKEVIETSNSENQKNGEVDKKSIATESKIENNVGLKVLDKIDLPQDKRSKDFKSKDNRKSDKPTTNDNFSKSNVVAKNSNANNNESNLANEAKNNVKVGEKSKDNFVKNEEKTVNTENSNLQETNKVTKTDLKDSEVKSESKPEIKSEANSDVKKVVKVESTYIAKSENLGDNKNEDKGEIKGEVKTTKPKIDSNNKIDTEVNSFQNTDKNIDNKSEKNVSDKVKSIEKPSNEVTKDNPKAKSDETISKIESLEGEEVNSDEPKKKKKRKKIMEVDPFEKVELKGLTIVGKIDLNAGKPNRQNRDNRGGYDNRDFRDRRDNRGGDNRGQDFRGQDNRSGENRPQGDNRQGDNRGQQGGQRPFDNRGGDNRQGDNRNNDNRPQDNRNFDRNNDRQGERFGNRPPAPDKGNLTVGRNTGDNRSQDNRDGDNRGPGNRPFDNRSGDNRGTGGQKPWENRPQGDRPQGGGRPWENRPQGDRPQGGGRPWENRPQGDRPQGGGRPWENRPQGDRPFGDRPPRDRGGSMPFENANFGGPPRTGGAFGSTAPKVKVKEFGEDAKSSASKNALEKKKKRKKGIRESISSTDVDKAIKNTLAEMEDSGSSTRAKIRQKKKLEREEKEQKLQEEQLIESKRLQLSEFVTTSDLAALIDTTPADIIMRCMKLGLMVTINQRLDKDTISLLADDFGFEVVFVEDTIDTILEDVEDSQEDLLERPAIVTIMGHVDHGKTSLLDYIRKTRVTMGEAGGITQHIGAYKVNLHEKSITFLDTPGHEAFTAMRARGAQITDIVILVVAADDMVMPQTIEAISHAKAANVPIIVAINKIDKPDANPDKIRQQLSDHDVLVEDWGGKYQCVELSAKQGINVDTLLEKILLEAELMELKANPERKARGVIIEANMDKGFGSTATVVVQKGTLRVGDAFVAGVSSGKVRGMFNETGAKVEMALPSQPVKVIGFDTLPSAGDTFISVNSESEARKIATDRKQMKREQELRQFKHVTLEEFSAKAGFGETKDLHLIIKADVDGSAEALGDSLLKLSTEEVRVNILHKAVGPISESDVMLAVASGAIIVGFHISPTQKAQRLADDEKVEIRNYDIIYDCINDIKMAMEGMLTPDIIEEITGNVEVRALFKNSKVGSIAGCYVLNGRIMRNDKIKVLRDGLPIHTGTLQSLKREKDDVREVETGFECGVLVRDFGDIKVNDIIQAFKMVEIKRKLK
jgi:translation initiation factor IF-2